MDMPGTKARYNSYGRFLKERFGCRVYKVSVDAGFSCPNRDGTVGVKGCIYCNNASFQPQSADRAKSVAGQIKTGIDYLKKRYRAEKFIAYFQPFTNTHAPLDALVPLYESALGHPDIVGLSIGTRPDCIDEAKIAYLESLASSYFITLEYGLQSIHDSTLKRINRGHDFQCWLDAMDYTRGRGIWLCAHLILGFPWESRDEMLQSAGVVSKTGLNFLKLHHLHVTRDTELERLYREKPFPLPTLEDYAGLVVDFVERLDPAVSVERFFGTAPEAQLIAPIWGKSKAEIQTYIKQKFVERDAWQGRRLHESVT